VGRSAEPTAAQHDDVTGRRPEDQQMTVVRAALTQTTWTGDKESMIKVHEEFVRDAAAQGAQVVCFQELFYGPYFGAVQDPKYFEYAESVPGPTVERFAALAREHRIVVVVPLYEEEQPGVLYNTAAVIDADGTYLGKYRKTHIPQLPHFFEKFYFRPGNLGWPVFDTAAGRIGVNICYDRHFPEGWRALGLAGAELVFNPSATAPGISNRLWELEQPAAAIANGYFIGANNRIGTESEEFGGEAVTFYGSSYFVSPTGNYVGDVASKDRSELIVRDLDLEELRRVRETWQFYRDRRPDAYGPLVAP
jgi:beta-ureidopropionase